MSRAQRALLVLWVAALSADRLNLLTGVTPFVFTPFLALTPLVIVSEWVRHSLLGRLGSVEAVAGGAQRSRVVVGREAVQYAITALVLLAVVWASVTVAESATTSASRAALLSAQVIGTWIVVVLARDREDLLALLGRAGVFTIALFAAADLAQVGAMFGAVPAGLRVGTVSMSLEPMTYESIIPRLTGLVSDPTRAGWTLLAMAWFAAIGERNVLLRRAAIAIAAVLVIVTLSRSALLAASVSILLVALSRRRLRVRHASVAAASAAAAILALGLLFVPAGRIGTLSSLAPISGRFSAAEASARDHVMVLERGLDEATTSVPRFAIGMGYGNAYVALQDVFPGNVYANFHSIYVSFLAESGIVALLCIVALIGLPLVRGGEWRPLVAGAAVVNVFYQTNADPAFWLVLAIAWIVTEVPAAKKPRQG